MTRSLKHILKKNEDFSTQYEHLKKNKNRQLTSVMICDVERKTAQTSAERQWGYREDFDSRRLSHRNFKQEPHLLKVQEFPFLPGLKAQEKVSERNLISPLQLPERLRLSK